MSKYTINTYTKCQLYTIDKQYLKYFKPEKALSRCNKKELFDYNKKYDELIESMKKIDAIDDARDDTESEEDEDDYEYNNIFEEG